MPELAMRQCGMKLVRVQMERAEESGKALILVNPKLQDIPSHSGIMGVRRAPLSRLLQLAPYGVALDLGRVLQFRFRALPRHFEMGLASVSSIQGEPSIRVVTLAMQILSQS